MLSGGSKIDDEKLLEQTGFIMKAGGSGVIYGRNVWQREWTEALEIVAADQGEPPRERRRACRRDLARRRKLDCRGGLRPPGT